MYRNKSRACFLKCKAREIVLFHIDRSAGDEAQLFQKASHHGIIAMGIDPQMPALLIGPVDTKAADPFFRFYRSSAGTVLNLAGSVQFRQDPLRPGQGLLHALQQVGEPRHRPVEEAQVEEEGHNIRHGQAAPVGHEAAEANH